MIRLMNLLQLMLGILPVPLMLGCHFFPQQLWLCGMYSILYLALGCLCLRIPGKWRVLAGILGCVLMIAPGLWLLPWRTEWAALGLPLLYTALLLGTLPMGGWDKNQSLPLNLSFIPLAFYMFIQFLLLTPMRSLYGAAATAVLLGFVGYLLLWLLMLNRLSLQSAASSRGSTPASMRQRNTLLTLLFAALLLLIAAIPAIAEWLARAWEILRDTLIAIWRFLLSLMPVGETAAGGGGGGNMLSELGMEAAEPSAFAKLMEKIVMVVAAVAIIALALWVGRFLWRRLRVLLRRLWALLQRYTLAASEDYVDEVSDTRESGDDSLSRRRRSLRRKLRQVNEESLSPAARIRYRYQRLLWKRLEWGPGTTARENLPEETAILYEKARYSSAEPSAEEAEHFAQAARTLEKKP